jgi:hypothetical protein
MHILIAISMPSIVPARRISMSTRSGRINGLEGFRGFLKRKPASKGGIAKQKLPRYPAGYVGRSNHRNESDRIKMRRILLL